MDVLVVGGTGFLGGAAADAAVTAGHAVSILTRGRTKRPAGPRVETIIADRFGDLSSLRGRHFDLVIDTCAFSPDAVASLLDALPTAGRYAFISSISAYADLSTPNLDETAPTSRATPEQLAMAQALPAEQRSSAASYGTAYGALKREAELVAQSRLGDRALILRVGLLVGAGDYTDRLTYWVRRIDQGGTIPLPGDPDRLVQLIDARDAAAFIVSAGEQGASGTLNLTGRPVSFAAVCEACRDLTGSNARFAWRPEAEILAAGLTPWSEVPLWLPSSEAAFRYLLEISTDKAFAAGLKVRDLRETVRNILDWDRGRRATPLKAGMPPEKEARLLASEI